ncbi:HAMP domain-containing histidine kinase [Rothia sp. AR01]|uniref:histidine kinase n=1 Tax=Rothia santali TaxID=2949643 RepID=A0A9X2H8I5_9MICC|nr:HAMP domain-containing sensor histidine kinase [Rothia santali]MCP3424671.1 HAMP domain-containing histidine kinase [Rothia santali]
MTANRGTGTDRRWWRTEAIAQNARLRVVVPECLFTLLLMLAVIAYTATLDLNIRPGFLWSGVGLCLGVTALGVLLPWERAAPRWIALLPVGDMVSVGLLRLGLLPEGISLSLLLFAPAIWLVILLQRRGLIIAVVVSVVAVSVPSLFYIPPYFSPGGLVRNSLLPLAVLLISWLALLLYQRMEHNLNRLVTAQRQKERLHRIARTQARLLTGVGEALNVGILVLDVDGNDVLYNRAQRTIHTLVSPPTNADKTEAGHFIYRPNGKTPVPVTERPAYRAARGEIFEGMIVVAGPPESQQKTLSVSSRHVLNGQGEHEATVLIFQDVTELQDAVRERDKFVATVSHELRTPLTSIIGYTDLALDEAEEDPLMAEYLDVVLRNSKHLRTLVEELLLEQQTRIGRTDRNLEPTDIGRLVERAVESQQPQAVEKGQSLTAAVGGPAPLLSLERSRIMQVLNNLITNAVKYTPPGGRIRVSTDVAPGAVGFTVTDDGPGMEPEDGERIFSPFFRTQSATQGGASGAGIGLSLSRAIVEAHEGHISVKTAPGRGTSISVSIPIPAEEGSP